MRGFSSALLVSGLVLCIGFASAAESGKPINTICPVTGKAVDPTIPPVVVTIGKGERSRKILIGVADAASAQKVKARPDLYADAAKANHQVDAH